MPATQTCPACQTVNKVFGLATENTHSGTTVPKWVTCWKCGQNFQAVDAYHEPKEAA
jgi:hypothetical protein